MLFVFAVITAGCQTCTGVGDFTVTRDTDEVVIEGQANPLDDVLPVKVVPDLALDFDLQNELEEQDAKGAKAVYLTALELRTTETSLEEGDEDTFDFLNRVEFYVESADQDSTLEKKRIASMDPVPEGQTSLDLETDDTIDLKPYAQEGIVITTAGEGTVPQDDVSVIGTVTVEVQTL
jgi:hypothetical protein